MSQASLFDPDQAGAASSAPPAATPSAQPSPAQDPAAASSSPPAAPITTAEMLAEIESELRFRRHVYDRRVADGKMKARDAERKIAVMARAGKVVAWVNEHEAFIKRSLAFKAELEDCLVVLEASP